jgi:serine/threonine protein kinase
MKIKKKSKIIFLSKENQIDNPKNYLLVTEYADNGTLQNYLSKCFKNLTCNDKLNLALQLANAISFLHDKEIMHCNLVGYLLTI